MSRRTHRGEAEGEDEVARVEITIHGRKHDLICDDGQEDHLRYLAAQLDRRLTGLTEQVGNLLEARLLVMAALMLVDELDEVGRRAPPPEGLLEDLDAAARRLEEIAEPSAAS